MAIKVVKPHVWSVVIGAVETLRYMKLFVFEVTVLLRRSVELYTSAGSRCSNVGWRCLLDKSLSSG